MAVTRFAGFTDVELLTLWEQMAWEDGIYYDPASQGGHTQRLGAELLAEWRERHGATADINAAVDQAHRSAVVADRPG